MRKYKSCFIHEQGIRCVHPLHSPASPFVMVSGAQTRVSLGAKTYVTLMKIGYKPKGDRCNGLQRL